MTTILRNKDGTIAKVVTDTQYHDDGTGPRDASGQPIVEHEPEPKAADGAGASAPSAAAATASKRED